jgi:hypothetical protein
VGTEIQHIEKTLAGSGLSVSARRGALIRLARLRQLGGDLAGAAESWLAAASTAGTGPESGAALVSGAYCLAASGEWEQSLEVLRPLLAEGRPGPALVRACFLEACVKTWSGADASALSVLAANPEFAEIKSGIYYALWKSAPAASAESWKQRLLTEFPHSPEGRIAAGENGAAGPAVSARLSPLWLLLPGRESVTLTAAAPAAAVQTAAREGARQAGGAASPSAGFLQTGLFSREANAQAQIDRLAAAGFSASMTRRTVNNAEYWAVIVPAGQQVNRAILELKNAGFESFPVFE